MAKELALIARLKPKALDESPVELEQVAQRIATSGYPLRSNPNFVAISKQRADYVSCVQAIAEHLGRPNAILIRQG